MSKIKLLLGAAGLFLFIVGVKRSYRPDDAGPAFRDDGALPNEPDAGERSPEAPSPAEANAPG